MPQGQKYVTQFFKVLHYGLTSSDQVIKITHLYLLFFFKSSASKYILFYFAGSCQHYIKKYRF